MATASQNLITIGSEYANIVSAIPALADVPVILQNLDDDTIDIVCAATPSGKGPIRLDTLDSVVVTASAIWVRGSGQISATVA